MRAAYLYPEFSADGAARTVTVRFTLVNAGEEHWRTADGVHLGWQIFDPDTGTFISEGEWSKLPRDLAPAETAKVEVAIALPKERGRYHVYVSPLRESSGWLYQQGSPFLLIEAEVEGGLARLIGGRQATLASLRRRAGWQTLRRLFTLPFATVWRHGPLIRTMVRRDILARYRGSAGGALWAVANPLLLMLTYFFVFGIVLESRFGADRSRTGFALYFLAGMLPWLAFSEAVGRAPHVILEHRNFVKKLVFPVEVLPVTQVAAGVVTQGFALLLFLAALLVFRGGIPAAIAWLPALLIPQVLFTLGLAWFLAALGVYLRDLGQIMGFVLTLWFFLTPICYPEQSLPAEAAAILTKNPIYVLVRGYRAVLLEGAAPWTPALGKLWVVAIAVFLAGHAWFYKLRRSFADII